MLLTRPPLYSAPEGTFLARLACVKPAANVRSEPGSNSPVEKFELSRLRVALFVRAPKVRTEVRFLGTRASRDRL